MGHSENPKHKPSSAEQMRRQTVLCVGLLKKLAAAFRVELTEETQIVYLENLVSYRTKVLESAVNQTIRDWDKPSMMPTVNFILQRIDRAVELERLERDSRAILPETKPDFDPEERKREAEEIIRNAQLQSFPSGRVFTEAEQEKRIQELRKQAEEIKRRALEITKPEEPA